MSFPSPAPEELATRTKVEAEDWNALVNAVRHLHGDDGTISVIALLQATATPTADGDLRQLFQGVDGNSAYNASPRAGIGFVGKYNVAGDNTMFGGLQGGKENATDGNSAGYLSFHTVPNGGSTTERGRFTSTGRFAIGTTSADELLHVANAAGAASIQIENEHAVTLGDPTVKFARGGTVQATVGWDDSAARFAIALGSTLGTGDVLAAVEGTTDVYSNGGIALHLDWNNNQTGRAFDITRDAGGFQILTVFEEGLMVLGDGNHADSNANMTTGLTINQGGNDDQILCLKSTDIATGLSNVTEAIVETDDFCTFQRRTFDHGGTRIQSMAVDSALIAESLSFDAYGARADTLKSTSGVGLITFYASQHNGANALADVAADGNVLAVRCRRGGAKVTVFLIDEDGDVHGDAGSGAANSGTGYYAYDEFDDAALVRALELERNPAGLVRTEFDRLLQYGRRDLEAARIATFNDGPEGDGHVFVNYSALARLHSGAIWQQSMSIHELRAECAGLRQENADMRRALVGAGLLLD